MTPDRMGIEKAKVMPELTEYTPETAYAGLATHIENASPVARIDTPRTRRLSPWLSLVFLVVAMGAFLWSVQ